MKVIYTEKSLYFVKNGILYLDLILRKVPAMINITKEDYRTKLTSVWRPQFYQILSSCTIDFQQIVLIFRHQNLFFSRIALEGS